MFYNFFFTFTNIYRNTGKMLFVKKLILINLTVVNNEYTYTIYGNLNI